jgi:hypothetical protein
MEQNTHKDQPSSVTDDASRQKSEVQSSGGEEIKLRRWLVSFSSGRQWYPVGEFVALDATSAIDRAIEVFGTASDHRAEEIPWDAAPLPRPKTRNKG